MKDLNLQVVSPEALVFEGPIASVVAPAWDGNVGILPGHAPMIALLGSGELAIELPSGGPKNFFVAGGVLKMEDTLLTILTEYAGTEPPAELPPLPEGLGDVEAVLEATGSLY